MTASQTPASLAGAATRLPPTMSIALSVLAATGLAGERASQYSLALAQAASVAWLARLGWSPQRRWATPAVMVAAAWIPTFLVSSWIYCVDPALLDLGSPLPALALVELSLLALIAGFGLWRRDARAAAAPRLQLAAARPDPRSVAAWVVVGLAGLGVVLAAAGGPIHYLRHINDEGSLTRGLSYFIVLGLALLFVAQVVVFLRWSRGLPTGRWAAAGLLAALTTVGVLGARLVIATALVQTIFFHGLIRTPVRLRVLAPVVVVAAVLLTLVAGAAKRYAGYQARHPGSSVGLTRYLTAVAPGETASAFANNYADGVRLVALSLATVPAHAGYEYGKEMLRLLLQPLPHAVRPVIAPAPGLAAALYPGGGYVYAQPLQVVSYLQFGLPGVGAAFVLFGVLLAEFDFRLAAARRLRPSTLVAMTAAAVDALATLRGASAPSVAFALASLLVMYAVARSSERLTAAAGSG